MKLRWYMAVIWLMVQCPAFSQNLFPALDKSPLDLSYYPPNYPYLRVQEKTTGPLIARVIYSRPQKNGRVLFGDLIEYKKIWRLGANEATEIEFFEPVTIGNAKLKKGRYSLYAIPDTVRWIMVVNRETDTWGTYRYDQKKDVARVTVPVEEMEEPLETLCMYFDRRNKGFVLVIAWDKYKITLPVSL